MGGLAKSANPDNSQICLGDCNIGNSDVVILDLVLCNSVLTCPITACHLRLVSALPFFHRRPALAQL